MPIYSEGNVGGRGVGFTLGPAQNVFTGATRAAAESARDTYFTNNPSNLTSYNDDTALNIRLEYTDNGNAVALYQVRNEAGDAWIDNSSAIGVRGAQGADGTDGVDAIDVQFASVAARDTFFTANPDILMNNLPITVTVADNTTETQIWTGITNPATYNAATDAILWLPSSIRSGASSFELADSQAITAGGDNVLLEERVRDISAAPLAQILGNHQTPSNRVIFNTPIARRYTPGDGEAPFPSAPSPAATTGSVPFETSFTVGGENTALFGLAYIPTEDYAGVIEYELVNTDANRTVYTARLEVDLKTDVEFTQWFRSPASSRAGANVRGRLYKADRTLLNVRPRTDNAAVPYTNSHLRRYVDAPIATQAEMAKFINNVVVAGSNITVSLDDVNNTFTISAATPRTDEEIRDLVASFIQGGAGITVTHDDANDTLTIAESTPVTPTTEVFYYGLSDANNPATVDVSTLTSENVATGSGQEFTFSVGPAAPNDYVIILVPTDHDLTSLTNTLSGFSVLNSYTRTADVRTINGVIYVSYTLGPLVDQFTASYRAVLA